VRSVDSAALSILRVIEEEGIKSGAGELTLHMPTKVALYILNQKRAALADMEKRYGLQVALHCDDTLSAADHRLERARSGNALARGPAVNTEQVFADTERSLPAPLPHDDVTETSDEPMPQSNASPHQGGSGGQRRGGRFNNNRGGRNNRPPYQDRPPQDRQPYNAPQGDNANGNVTVAEVLPDDHIGNTQSGYVPPVDGQDQDQRRGGRRRGRRGGRGRHGGGAPGAGVAGNRPPRDPNYQPRDHTPRDNVPRENTWNRGYDAPAAQPAAPIAAIPVSIHDIDTTPRDFTAPRATQQSSAPTKQASSSPPPYQVINEAPSDKKGGWWRRLTGQ